MGNTTDNSAKPESAKKEIKIKTGLNRFFHRLDSIEDVDEFYEAIDRKHLSQALNEDRPYTYWTIEL